MLILGTAMYAFWLARGHYYIDGVGYATIQSTLDGQIQGAGFLLLLAAAKLLATSVSLGSGSSGGIFSPSLYMGATLGAAFAALVTLIFPGAAVSLPAFAMVGMGAMVGGGTGAAMTAVTMIFEMTRDYNIVLPMILAVAVALGTRRLLSRENMYTMKLVRRGRAVPKARHANLFLVRLARDVMETDIDVLPAETTFGDYLGRPGHAGRIRHIVVTRGGRLLGFVRVNTALRQALDGAAARVTLGEMASRAFTVARADTVVADVVRRLRRREAVLAIVTRGAGAPRGADVLGVIGKEHVADSVADSVSLYPR